MSLFNTLFRLGIISGLSDREAFVSKTSQLIERYYDDPECAPATVPLAAKHCSVTEFRTSLKFAFLRHLSKGDRLDSESILAERDNEGSRGLEPA